MKKIIALIVLAIFLAALPVLGLRGAISANASAVKEQLREQMQDVRARLTATQKLNESRIEACRQFLADKDSDPAGTCTKLSNRQINCVEYLQNKGVAEPLAKCNNLFRAFWSVTKVRGLLAQNVSDEAGEPRLKRLDRLAENHPNATRFIKNLSAKNAQLFLYLPRAEQKKLLNISQDKAKNILGRFTLKKVASNMLFKQRSIAKQDMKQAEEDYQKATDNYKSANQAYKYYLERFRADRVKLNKCNQSEKCSAYRQNATELAKNVIINGANMIIEHLRKIKDKVHGSENIDGNKSVEIAADIDNAIAKIQAAIEKVRAATTKEEVQAAAKDIINIWKEVKPEEVLHAAWLVHASVWNIMQRSQHLEDKLDQALSDLQDKNISVDLVQAEVDNFSAKVSDAREKYNNATGLLKQAYGLKKKNATEQDRARITELVSQAKALLLQAHNDLKEAHTMLVKIVRDIKAAGGEIDTSETKEEIVVEESQ
jgi:uncharacterized protein YoxC